MYIFLGGDEAREAGLVVAKTTGIRNSASIYTDDQGLQTLFIPDIYERVYPSVLNSLDILGVKILERDQSNGNIKIILDDKEASNKGFFNRIFSNESSEELVLKVDLANQGKATVITVENTTYTRINSPASEEVIRGLYVNLR